ncbi:MAG: hypothetical protein CMH57_12805 [Myxococcales bacterium]|nr:hypothetical protein [Myxococcales bacterium]
MTDLVFVLAWCILALAGCQASDHQRLPASSGAAQATCEELRLEASEGGVERASPDALATLVAAPRGCASTFEAGLRAAELASDAERPAQQAALLAYTRRGLRDQHTWAALGLDEADAWLRAGRAPQALEVWSEIWHRLAEPGFILAPRVVSVRHQALMGLWEHLGARPGLPERQDQVRHLIDLTRVRQRGAARRLLGRWVESGWIDARTDRPLMAQLGDLNLPRRKRRPASLPSPSEVSAGGQALLQALQGERALVVAVRDPSGGLTELERLIERAPTHPERPTWHLQAAQLALVTEEPVRLAQHALEALSGDVGAGVASEALWLVALAHIRAGRLEGARPFLELSARHSQGRVSDVAIELSATDPAARALYWLGRIDEQQGRLEQARAQFAEVQQAYPVGLYHVLSVDAFNRLGGAPEQLRMVRRLPGVPPPPSFPPAPPSPADRAILTHMEALPGHALAAALDQARYTTLGPGRHERLLDLAHPRLERAESIWLAYTLPPVGGWDVRHGQAHHRFDRPDPRPHRPAIAAAAIRAGLDPEWVLALIRQESGFQARACSGSRACGLMQLKMSAAKTIARADSIPFEGTTEALFQTETNLRLGTALLARLERKTGDPLRALASYNAGPGAVRRWELDPDAIAPDLFLELMPDRRTRAYVIGIVVRYGLYAALLDSGQIRRLIQRPALP